MNKLVLSAVLTTLGVAACSHLREPDDAQLANLLLGERAAPSGATAPLDPRAIECLRAWSGESDLLEGLSMRYAGEDGKKTCRTTLDARLADATRNPDAFTFAEVSAPNVVRRALELARAGRLAAPEKSARLPMPGALMRPQAAATTLATPAADVDLGIAGTRLIEAEGLCQQTQQAAASGGKLQRFATYCTGSLRKLRLTMEGAARSGRNAAQLDALAGSADNVARTARSLLAAPRE